MYFGLKIRILIQCRKWPLSTTPTNKQTKSKNHTFNQSKTQADPNNLRLPIPVADSYPPPYNRNHSQSTSYLSISCSTSSHFNSTQTQLESSFLSTKNLNTWLPYLIDTSPMTVYTHQFQPISTTNHTSSPLNNNNPPHCCNPKCQYWANQRSISVLWPQNTNIYYWVSTLQNIKSPVMKVPKRHQ